MDRISGPGHDGRMFVAQDKSTGRPPTEFTAEWFNGVQESIVRTIEAAEIEPSDVDFNQFTDAISILIGKAITTALTTALAPLPRVYSITALPTANVGPIIVKEVMEVWGWSASAYFTGYRSPLCGRPVDGHTLAPLASEFDAVGGILGKAAYAGVWGYAQENGLVVTQAIWTANIGSHYFVDVDANTFRVPDLRNMFRRYTGTDADTANATTLGSFKTDTLKKHGHNLASAPTGQGGSVWYFLNGAGSMVGSAPGNVQDTGFAETAPKRTAYHPRIRA